MTLVTKHSYSISAPEKEENGDAYLISSDSSAVVLADGATRSFLSPIWARVLVEHFIDSPQNWLSIETIGDAIKNARVEWKTKAERWISEKFGGNITSRVNNGLLEGSASTLLGAKIFILENVPTNSPSNIVLYSIGIGDTCLFVLRNKLLIESFPPKQSEDFSNYPSLLYSYNHWNERKISFFRTALFPDDLVVFMTDNLAQFFLSAWEKRDILVVERLIDFGNEREWADFIETERRERHNFFDDITQISIHVSNG